MYTPITIKNDITGVRCTATKTVGLKLNESPSKYYLYWFQCLHVKLIHGKTKTEFT